MQTPNATNDNKRNWNELGFHVALILNALRCEQQRREIQRQADEAQESDGANEQKALRCGLSDV